MIAVESLPGRKLGRVRIEVADVARSTSSLMDFATRTIEKGSTIRTDGATNLRRLSTLGYQHEYFVGLRARNSKTRAVPRPMCWDHAVGITLLDSRGSSTRHGSRAW